MPAADAIRSTIEQYLDRFSEADRDGWLALWAPDAEMEDPVGSPVKRGHDEIGAFFDQSHTMADALRLVPTGPLRICGDEAAFPMQARPRMGGVEFVVDIIDVMRFDDEARIVAMRAFWDPATMRPADS